MLSLLNAREARRFGEATRDRPVDDAWWIVNKIDLVARRCLLCLP